MSSIINLKSNKSQIALGAFALSSFLAAAYLFITNRQQQKQLQNEKETTARIRQILFYPLSGCRGVMVDEWKLNKTGFELDREWTLVEDSATHKKIDGLEKLYHVHTRLEGMQDPESSATLVLDYVPFSKKDEELRIAKLPPLRIKLFDKEKYENANKYTITTYGAEVQVVDEGDEAARWFTTVCADEEHDNENRNFRLVRVAPGSVRKPYLIDCHRGCTAVNESDALSSFTVFSSIHAVTQESMDFIQQRLPKNIVDSDNLYLTAERFRANLLLSDVPAWKEEEWKTAEIVSNIYGDSSSTSEAPKIPLRGSKVTGRCSVILRDPRDGSRASKMEPMRTIRKFHEAILPYQLTRHLEAVAAHERQEREQELKKKKHFHEHSSPKRKLAHEDEGDEYLREPKHKAMFGIEFFHDCAGVVRVGDLIRCTSKCEPLQLIKREN